MITNIPLLQKALEHIDAHPDEWEQGSWGQFTSRSQCGTACCLAGHIALIDGWKPVREKNDDGWAGVQKDGVRAETEDAAIAALGAHHTDVVYSSGDGLIGEHLFGASHNREELWRLAHVLTDGQITLPADITPA